LKTRGKLQVAGLFTSGKLKATSRDVACQNPQATFQFPASRFQIAVFPKAKTSGNPAFSRQISVGRLQSADFSKVKMRRRHSPMSRLGRKWQDFSPVENVELVCKWKDST